MTEGSQKERGYAQEGVNLLKCNTTKGAWEIRAILGGKKKETPVHLPLEKKI